LILSVGFGPAAVPGGRAGGALRAAMRVGWHGCWHCGQPLHTAKAALRSRRARGCIALSLKYALIELFLGLVGVAIRLWWVWALIILAYALRR
jgi:hypothetical protein